MRPAATACIGALEKEIAVRGRQPATGKLLQHALLVGIVLLSLSLLGCAGGFNVPFINTDETMQLRFGMTTDQVIDKLGTPYYVHSGGDGMVEWVYEVRTEYVRSQAAGVPSKVDPKTVHGQPVHRLAVDFQDGKLVRWAPLNANVEVAK